ncbi:uncharacterized protein K444DRAFT_471846, partial [Hyaloscypha bicolor E]
LDKYSLFYKLEKYEFNIKEVKFLGYIILYKEIKINKTRLVPEIARKTLVFLDFCNFYRRFI